jgi:L-2-hydroxyglutarate oxidase LhgO
LFLLILILISFTNVPPRVVKRLRIVDKKELFEMEPHVNPAALAALHSPDAGNLIPYEFAIAMAESAADNGVEIRIRRQVTAITKPADSSDGLFTVTADHWEPKDYAKVMPADEKVVSSNPNEKSTAAASSSSPLTSALFLIPLIFGVFAPKFLVDHDPVVIYALSGVLALILFLLTPSSSSSSSRLLGKGTLTDQRSPVGSGGSPVTVSEMLVGGSGSKAGVSGVTVGTETFRARYIVNAAGGYADKISNMIGDDSFYIKPRLGDYLLLNRNQGSLARHTLFPCPGPLGKGVLVQTTLWGNLILGPTARDTNDPAMANMTDDEVQTFILSKCKDLVPTFDPKEVIHGFCGARAKSSRGDWIIEPSEKSPNFIQAAGIDSPGLAGSPAIAVEVVRLLSKAGLKLTKNKNFNPIRAPIIVPKDGWKGIKAGPVGKFTDPKQNVVCKCEKVTEAEVVEAMKRSLPIDSTQAIRKRTRAGMGSCQAKEGPDNYNCECRVATIIARENGYKKEAEVGRRPWPATSTLPQRWIGDDFKAKLSKFMGK